MEIDSKLFNEVGNIFKVKDLNISSYNLDRLDISSFKFLENLTINCNETPKIIWNVISIKHLVLNEVDSISSLQILLSKFKPVISLEIKLL